jgi:hypothetical protein
MSRTIVLLTVLFVAGATASASADDTFRQLAGQWRGGGTVNYADGKHEPVHCRAAYDVLRTGNEVQLNIRCASTSYNFDLMGSARERDGRVSGTWSEASRNVSGSLSGTAQDGRVNVQARSPAMSATLTLVTHGSRQSVSIRSQDPQSTLRGATLSLRR